MGEINNVVIDVIPEGSYHCENVTKLCTFSVWGRIENSLLLHHFGSDLADSRTRENSCLIKIFISTIRKELIPAVPVHLCVRVVTIWSAAEMSVLKC